jgi:hypothetical protein
MKEKGEASYKASENLHLLHGFLEFVVDLGLNPAILEEVQETVHKIRYLPIDGESEPEPYYGQRQSERDMADERRCGVPSTRAYKQGRTGFYLPEMVMKGNEDSRRMLSVPFILKDFVKAFFGPTLDFRARLRNLPDKPVVASEATSSEPGLSLEEHLDVESSKSLTGASQRSPTPTRLAASAVAGHVSAPENEEPPGSGIQDDSLSASSSAVGSPELSPVVSISPVSFIDRAPTPSRPSDKQDKSLSDPAIIIVAPSTEMDLDQGSTIRPLDCYALYRFPNIVGNIYV